MRLQDFCALYCSQRDVKQSHVDQLRYCVIAFERVMGPQQVEDITPETIATFLRRQRDRGLARETRVSRRRQMLTLCRDAARRGLSAHAFWAGSVAPVAYSERPPKGWTLDQVEQLVAAACQLRGPVSRRLAVPADEYWTSYFRAAWESGLRGCDVRRFRRDTIGPDRVGWVVEEKTGLRKRFRLEAETLAIVDRRMAADSDQLLWPLWCSLDNWRKRAAKIVRAAGLPGSVGWLRHSSGTDVEIHNPGQGHLHTKNTRAIFETNYRDDRQLEFSAPTPTPLRASLTQPHVVIFPPAAQARQAAGS